MRGGLFVYRTVPRVFVAGLALLVLYVRQHTQISSQS